MKEIKLKGKVVTLIDVRLTIVIFMHLSRLENEQNYNVMLNFAP